MSLSQGQVKNGLGDFPRFRAGEDGDAVQRGVNGMLDALVDRINLPCGRCKGERRGLGLATGFLDLSFDRDGR